MYLCLNYGLILAKRCLNHSKSMKIAYKALIIISLLSGQSLGQDGYFGSTNMNLNLGAKDVFTGYSIGFSFTTVHGYGYRNWFGVAGGLGVLHDPVDLRTFSPFFIQFSSSPLKSTISPYAAFEIGYTYQWAKFYEDEFTQVYGGLFLHPQLGIRIGKPNGIQGLIGIGWMRMNSRTVTNVLGTPDKFIYGKTYKRYTFNLGIRF